MSHSRAVVLIVLSMTAFGACQPAAFSQDSAPKRPTVATAEVGPVPTPPHIVNLMLEIAGVKKADVLYDLGCGDGRIVVAASARYGCRARGFDIDPECVRESRDNVKNAGLEELVTISQEDIFQLDLSEVDVVTLYLLPRLNVKLIPQLEKMKPGSRIVSHEWDMLGVQPDMEVDCYSRTHGTRSKIYMWTTPLTKIEVPDEPEKEPFRNANDRLLIGLVASALAVAALLFLLSRLFGFNIRVERVPK